MIEINTEQRVLSNNIILKPTDPTFLIDNDGGIAMYINNNFKLLPQQSFGLNMDSLVAKFQNKGYEVVMNTQYAISFEPSPALTGNPLIDIIIFIWYSLSKHATFKQITTKIL
jgi:hypothetical protein